MKLVATWALDKVKTVPEPKACTSKPCFWSIPQSRSRIEKFPISDVNIISPLNKPKKDEECTSVQSKKRKGIKSTLFDARAELDNNNELIHFLVYDKNNHASNIINEHPKKYVRTIYGNVPVGSCLNYQCSLMPADFKVYCNVAKSSCDNNFQVTNYPTFPFIATGNVLDNYILVNKITCNKTLKVIDTLKEQAKMLIKLSRTHKNKLLNPNWFEYRKFRFTASLFNKIGDFSKKTPKGFTSLAHAIVFGESKGNNVLKMKMAYGKFYEPIAIQMYERYFKVIQEMVSVEQCGLIVDKENVIFGATPDGKINHSNNFGIMEVKCCEQYKDVVPKDICYIAKNPCIVYDKEKDVICINKNHSYY